MTCDHVTTADDIISYKANEDFTQEIHSESKLTGAIFTLTTYKLSITHHNNTHAIYKLDS